MDADQLLTRKVKFAGLGPAVRHLRITHQPPLSNIELSRRSGLSPGMISMIESGQRTEVSGETLLKLAKGFGITLNELFRYAVAFHPDHIEAEAALLTEFRVTNVATDADCDRLLRLYASVAADHQGPLLGAILQRMTTTGPPLHLQRGWRSPSPQLLGIVKQRKVMHDDNTCMAANLHLRR